MICRTPTIGFTLMILLAAAGLAWAQPPEKTPPPQGEKKDKFDGPTTPKTESKDPTEMSPKLKELMIAGKQGTGPGAKMPMLALRGRVIAKDQPAVALLEVDKQMHLIAKGSAISGGGNTILHVLEITTWEVRIEVLPMKEIIVLR